MIDTKQTKSIGEHHVAAELARRGWAPALTRDGLARTDILAVKASGSDRHLVELQVKTARGSRFEKMSWPLGSKSQVRSMHDREFFVMVAVPADVLQRPRCFVVPRIHVAAAAWIEHMAWLTDNSVPSGTRNASVERSRVKTVTFQAYEDRWDLLDHSQLVAPIMLPTHYRDLAQTELGGLPPEHEWVSGLPEWHSRERRDQLQ